MRLALMSLAHLHAEGYVNSLRTVPDVELIGAADDELERGQRFAHQFDVNLFSMYADLLREQPDGVVICCENARHRELVELALAAGIKHVLCEKPLATTLDDAQAILNAVDT